MGDDYRGGKLPKLTHDNWRQWFQMMKARVGSKGGLAIFDKTRAEQSALFGDTAIEWDKQNSNAIFVMLSGLDPVDAASVETYENAKDIKDVLWTKYNDQRSSSVVERFKDISTYKQKDSEGILTLWTNLNKIKLDIVNIDASMKPSFTDKTMLQFFLSSLQPAYEAMADTFKASSDEKPNINNILRKLQEKESAMKSTETGMYARKGPYKPPFRRDNTARYNNGGQYVNSSGKELVRMNQRKDTRLCKLCDRPNHSAINCPRFALAKEITKCILKDGARGGYKALEAMEMEEQDVSQADVNNDDLEDEIARLTVEAANELEEFQDVQ